MYPFGSLAKSYPTETVSERAVTLLENPVGFVDGVVFTNRFGIAQIEYFLHLREVRLANLASDSLASIDVFVHVTISFLFANRLL